MFKKRLEDRKKELKVDMFRMKEELLRVNRIKGGIDITIVAEKKLTALAIAKHLGPSYLNDIGIKKFGYEKDEKYGYKSFNFERSFMKIPARIKVIYTNGKIYKY
jgi:hypothetical protein